VSTALPEITVLIPTRGAVERTISLRQAIESVLCQQGVTARVIVLVNGPNADAALPAPVLADPRVTILRRAVADLPAAFQHGARAVDTPWFGTLDDDDLLLPGALKLRHAALERHPECLVATGNGFRHRDGVDTLHVTDARDIRRDPLRALLLRNWLLPGSWLCRTTPVTRALFDEMPRYLECTYLGIRFAALGLTWIDEPTVRYTVGSAVSESHSGLYIEGQAAALRHILRLDLPRYARRDLRARISAAHHRTANIALQDGRIADAWRLHLRTLTAPGGWRYLPLVRHLIRASLR
jgi:hypothetical protein